MLLMRRSRQAGWFGMLHRAPSVVLDRFAGIAVLRVEELGGGVLLGLLYAARPAVAGHPQDAQHSGKEENRHRSCELAGRARIWRVAEPRNKSLLIRLVHN